MPAVLAAPFGLTVFALTAAALVLAAVGLGVKLRAAYRRGGGVRVCDLGADLTLPPSLNSRSYQIAFYLTMKSLPREPAAAGKISGPGAGR